jgi:Bacterial extracellular solute-binding protein
MTILPWPVESACQRDSDFAWSQPPTNVCLDFHGDPARARLVVFSDGNHHMALADALREFYRHNPDVGDIFYATTPPSVVVNLLQRGGLRLGNLSLSIKPHLFISPPNILDSLQADGYVNSHQAFMQSRGNVLLVRAGNPKQIHSIADLRRAEVRLFISNPITETASYQVYAQTLVQFAATLAWVLTPTLVDLQQQMNLVIGERIHHREAPQALYAGYADAAILYYHLALRYTRIFPGEFTLIQLDGEITAAPKIDQRQVVSAYHLGVVGDGGSWGLRLQEFLLSATVSTIYAQHGLTRPT